MERIGRTAVVTGGAGGIGGAVSSRFAASGTRVLLNDVDGAAAERAAAAIAAAGGECRTVVGDIRDPATVAAVVEGGLALGSGRIDVLVNDVGDFRPSAPSFVESSEEQWQQMYELNLLHVLRTTRAVLPTMLAQGSGAIVNNATVEAFRGIPGHAAYSAFNAGVVAFTRSLAVEVGGRGVRVNAIAPDLVNTLQTDEERKLRGRDPALVRTWLPLARFGTPDDCAAVVEFLASDAARFVTGHTLPVDGGTLAASGWFARADGPGWTNMPDHT